MSLIFVEFANVSNFSPILDCGTSLGCPLDAPFLLISLDDYFVTNTYCFVPKEVMCAFLCQINKECVSFNQLPNNECQLLRTLPYKIIASTKCKLFQVS